MILVDLDEGEERDAYGYCDYPDAVFPHSTVGYLSLRYHVDFVILVDLDEGEEKDVYSSETPLHGSRAPVACAKWSVPYMNMPAWPC